MHVETRFDATSVLYVEHSSVTVCLWWCVWGVDGGWCDDLLIFFLIVCFVLFWLVREVGVRFLFQGCFMIRVRDQSHLRWKTMCFRYVWYYCFCIVGEWNSMFPKFCGIKYLWTIFMTGQRQSFSERTHFWRNTTLDATVWGKIWNVLILFWQ